MAGGRNRKRAAPPRTPARAARPPVLGNDPFSRGAAPRPPAPAPALDAPGAVEPAPLPGAAAPAPAAGRRPPPGPSSAATSARVDDVERRLEATLEGIEDRLSGLAARAGLVGARAELGEALARVAPALLERLGALLDAARLLEPPERLDRFGMDARLAERAAPLVDLLYSGWWRTAVRGAEHLPETGPLVVVANHAGRVPWDALVLREAVRRARARDLRPLLDDRESDAPVTGPLAIRLGAVRASPEAAERILADGGAVGVFPEGSASARKPWRDRYRIQRFGRGGFVKLALRCGAPVVPCAIVGSEEAAPGISRTGWLADRLGIPLLSASPRFVLGPAAFLPLPSRWSLRFGPPVDLGARRPSDPADPALVSSLTERVRSELQAMLDEDVAARTSVFL